MIEQLKPCPFATATQPSLRLPNRDFTDRLATAHIVYAAETATCFFGYDVDYGGTFDTKEEASEAWNRRANSYENTKRNFSSS